MSAWIAGPLMSGAELDAYFERIGHVGSRGPTLDTLRAIVLAHIQAIPFENLDVLLGKPIRLDDASIFWKLVSSQRGGYCFEQNGLLLWVLTSLGYDAVPISARVRLGRARDFTPPRSHMFVRVEIDGVSWLADVGVGGLSPTAPLRFDPLLLDTYGLDQTEAQETPHEPRRLVSEPGIPGRRVFHQARIAGEWQDICEFTTEPMPLLDREVANWFTSAHPMSHFRNRLLVARAGPDGERLTLLNREFTRRAGEGSGTGSGAPGPANVATTIVTDPVHLLVVLRDLFGLNFPEGTEFACEGVVWG